MAQVPPFAILETTPADNDFVRLYPNAERLFRDIVESWFGRISDAATGEIKVRTDTTANLAAITFPVGGIRFDTTLGVLQLQKTAGVWDTLSFPTGTELLFRQSSAPPGWTKRTDAVLTDSLVKVVTDGTGGTNGGATAFGTVFAARTITQANLPNVNFNGSTSSAGAHSHGGGTGFGGAHVHTFQGRTLWGSGGNNNDDVGTGGNNGQVNITQTDLSDVHLHTISSDGDHTHTATVASGGSGTALDFNVKFSSYIVCVKN